MNLENSERLFYGKGEFAAIFNLSVHTVTAYTRNGKIKAKKCGRRVLIPREEIQRFAAEGMQPVEAHAN
jgi:excisionase family DNA binding protein